MMGIGAQVDTLRSYYDYRKPKLNPVKDLRILFAIGVMGQMYQHFLQLSTGVDAKRAGHLVEMGKAIQSHNASQTEDKGRLERIIDKVKGR